MPDPLSEGSVYAQISSQSCKCDTTMIMRNGMRTDSPLITGSIPVVITKFMVPIMIGQLFQQMYNAADALIVGNFLSARSLAAVSSTSSLVYLIIGFCLGFSTGASVIVARRIGEGDEEATSRAVHTAVVIGIAISILTTLFGTLFADDLLALMHTPADILGEAASYLRIYFGGCASVVLYNMFVGIVQASGDSRHPLYYLLAGSVLNIILDLLFIAVFHTGVEGAAIATVISQSAAACLVLIQLIRATDATRLSFSKLRPDSENLRLILQNGFPAAVQDCAVAGIGSSIRAEGFAFIFITAFSIEITTFISQNIGAGEYERAEKGMRFTLVTAVAAIEAVGILMHFNAPRIISAFSSTPEVLFYGTMRLRICSLFYCLVGFSHISSAVMQGMGKPNIPVLVMVTCWCLTRVILLATVGQFYHRIELVCWIYPFTWFLSSAVYLFLLRKIKLVPSA